MKYILFSLLVLIGGLQVSATGSHVTDSILQQLKTELNPDQRFRSYRNLADICVATPCEKTYLTDMFREAQKYNNPKVMAEALSDLILIEVKALQLDSAYHHLKKMKKIADKEELKIWLPYFRMKFFDQLCYLGKQEEAIEHELALKKEQDSDHIYAPIVDAYITGDGFFMNKQYDKSIPYFETAYKLSRQLPRNIRYLFMSFTSWNLSFAYSTTGHNKKAIAITEANINATRQHYKEYIATMRPYYDINRQLFRYYAFIIANVAYLTPQQEQFYFDLVNLLGQRMTTPLEIYNYYLAMNNYYMFSSTHANPQKALQANDSLIKYAPIVAPQNLSGLYKVSSDLYESINDYAHALEFYKKSSFLKDSLTSKELQKQINELQVKYDLNKLNNEKSQLEIKNKRIWLMSLSSILLISFGASIYLYRNLKNEKATKIKLRKLKNKAEESEKMKQAFINSICHEIRTPLNAIVGFSDLIVDESIDDEMRSTFPHEIQENANALNALINSMLEVANLDVSDEKLPCEPTNITQICEHGMERMQTKAKEHIEYHLELPDQPTIIPTHEKYLDLVIENLLSNANKFTKEGRIILSYRPDETQQRLLISVTDTGCGIPADKREEVFQRFAKLDIFVPGNGLGLYLCRLIVQRLSGEIWIDPDYTAGSRFIVSLPCS